MPNRRLTAIMTTVATASTIPASRLHGHHDRPSMVSVGTIGMVWMDRYRAYLAQFS